MINVSFNHKMSKLMTNAWMLVKQRNLTLSAAMKLAWKVYNLREKGLEGQVEFDYIKKSTGELRHAVGTFNLKQMPKDASTFSQNSSVYTPMQIRYYDIEKQGWRSCTEDNLIAVY